MSWLRILKAPQRPKRRQPRPDSPEWLERVLAAIQADQREPVSKADAFERIDTAEGDHDRIIVG